MILAQQLLFEAATLLEARGKEYDPQGHERSMAAIVTAFNAITGLTLTEDQGWIFMVVLKLVRAEKAQPSDPVHDSYRDLIAYTSLLAESASKNGKKQSAGTQGKSEECSGIYPAGTTTDSPFVFE